jgi:hypothetical protein
MILDGPNTNGVFTVSMMVSFEYGLVIGIVVMSGGIYVLYTHSLEYSLWSFFNSNVSFI